MARIAGVDLPRDKRVEIGLTYIYGIGLSRAQKIIAATGVNPDTRVKDLTEADVTALRGSCRNHIPNRRRPPALGVNEHQAPDGHRNLSRSASPFGPACAGTTNPYQRQNPSWRPPNSCGQEKGTFQEVTSFWEKYAGGCWLLALRNIS